MTAQLMMLLTTVIIGLSLFFMVVAKKGSASSALYLWIIQLVVIFGISLFVLNLGLIETVTSAFGLITLLMFLRASTALSEVFNIPFLRAIGLAPAATFFSPSFIIA